MPLFLLCDHKLRESTAYQSCLSIYCINLFLVRVNILHSKSNVILYAGYIYPDLKMYIKHIGLMQQLQQYT